MLLSVFQLERVRADFSHPCKLKRMPGIGSAIDTAQEELSKASRPSLRGEAPEGRWLLRHRERVLRQLGEVRCRGGVTEAVKQQPQHMLALRPRHALHAMYFLVDRV